MSLAYKFTILHILEYFWELEQLDNGFSVEVVPVQLIYKSVGDRLYYSASDWSSIPSSNQLTINSIE